MPLSRQTRHPDLFLASRSPRRREILEELGVRFKVVDSPYREGADDLSDLSPSEQAAKLAALKAFYAAQNLHEGFVIGADTIVVLGNRIMGKPRDRDDARAMLSDLSGKSHKVITGLAVVDTQAMQTVSHAEITKVVFRGLSPMDIDRYLAMDEPYDKAGAYAIQGHAGLFIERIDGCYYNVVGLPIVALDKLLVSLESSLMGYIDRSPRK
jgi:septum formation protein